MELEAGAGLPDGGRRAEVLHDHAVESCLIHAPNKGRELRKLLLPCQRIDRQIDPNAEQVRPLQRVPQLLLREIPGIGSGAEILPGKVYRVRPCIQGAAKRLHVPGRGQELCFSTCFVHRCPLHKGLLFTG